MPASSTGSRSPAAGPVRSRAAPAVRWSAPLMSRTSSCAEVSARATVATDLPDRSTVMRSAISSISSMRCEMKITVPASARQPAHDREQPVARGDVQRRRRLVEDQDPRVAHERARDPADLAHAERQRLDRHVQRRGLAGQLGEHGRSPLALDVLRDAAAEQAVDAHPHVLQHGLRADDEDLLEDGHDARVQRHARRSDAVEAPARDLQRAAVRALHPGQDLDEGALARPVLTDDRVDVPGPRRERALAQRLRAPERLGEAVDREDDLALAGGRLGGRRQGGVLRGRHHDAAGTSASHPTWRRTDRGSPAPAAPRPAPARTRSGS